ncbi:MAG: 50S ribosomal protein L18 [Bacteroidetes bacterium GWE2_29_8]|nr:MAG: 50S ribosomal protein L18 [Bacteroidetes bacterium GWE2_29_8]OFY21203.1 MAG: 50S ribosomal protein L18 [Bacteroidetes bacterium GWF2_29_10]
MTKSVIERRKKIKLRIRKIVKGTTESPRLTIFRSNKEIYAQIIDDSKSHTLAYANTRSNEFKSLYSDFKGSKIEKAKLVGQLIAKKAVEAGINKIVFDRNGYLYHGRVKSLAEGAREAGLIF